MKVESDPTFLRFLRHGIGDRTVLFTPQGSALAVRPLATGEVATSGLSIEMSQQPGRGAIIMFLPKRRQIMERRPVLSYLWPGEEKRFAKRESKIVLAMYHVVRLQHPLLAGKALYEMVVAHRTGVSAADARSLVRAAEQSFAEWPSDRALTFRDVVHYLCFESFVKSHENHEWTRTSLREVVDSVIPKDL